MGYSPGGSKCEAFNCPFSVESGTPLVVSAICSEHCQPGKLTQALASRVLTGAGLHRHGPHTAFMADLYSGAPPGVQLIPHGQSSPHKLSPLVQCPRVNKDTLLRKDVPRILEEYFPGALSKARHLFG